MCHYFKKRKNCLFICFASSYSEANNFFIFLSLERCKGSFFAELAVIFIGNIVIDLTFLDAAVAIMLIFLLFIF